MFHTFTVFKHINANLHYFYLHKTKMYVGSPEEPNTFVYNHHSQNLTCLSSFLFFSISSDNYDKISDSHGK